MYCHQIRGKNQRTQYWRLFSSMYPSPTSTQPHTNRIKNFRHDQLHDKALIAQYILEIPDIDGGLHMGRIKLLFLSCNT